MRYCPDCGDPHECAAENERDDAKTKIRLAEIDASKEIRIAELRAGETETEAAAAVDIAAAEAVIDAAGAEGKAEGMETVIDAAVGAPPDAEADPVIVEVPGGDSGADPGPEAAAPKRAGGGITTAESRPKPFTVTGQ